MDVQLMPYHANIDQSTLLQSPAEAIWKKFVYFDKKAEKLPNCDKYDYLRSKLLDMWFEQFQKEYSTQGLIFKKGSKK